MFIVKALSYSRTYLSRQFAKCHLFSTPAIQQISKQQLSDSAQKAIVAFQIMNLILQEKMPKSFQGQSLSEQIISLGPKIGKYQIKSSIRQQFNEMFTSGIHLNARIDNQQTCNPIQDQKPMGQNKETDAQAAVIKNTQRNKFIFFPTHLTTGQIFQTLVADYEDKPLKYRDVFVTGGFGIGKSVSTILYNQLSRYIHEYHLKFVEAKEAVANKKATDQGIKLVQEYNRLIEQQLLFIVPKCLYWTINKNIDQKHKLSIEEVILQQLGELSEGKRKQLRDCIQTGNIQSFQRKLRGFYPQIHLKGVVDQLNILADMLREYNRHEQQSGFKILRSELGIKINQSKETVGDQNIQQNKRISILRILMRNLSYYRYYAHNAIFYSSFSIERGLLQASTPQKEGVQIYDHKWDNVPLESKIQFQELLREIPGANIIFWQYFYFQIERRLKLLKVSSQKLKEIKDAFFNKCEQAKVEANSYFRIVHIRIFFEQNDQMLLGMQNKQNAQLQGALFSVIESFHNHCVKSIVNMFNQFLAKDKKQLQQKTRFFVKLYNHAQACFSKNQKKQHSTTQIPAVYQKDSDKKKNYVKIESMQLDRFLNKYIQPYKQSEGVECQIGQMFLASHQLYGPSKIQPVKLLLSSKQAMEILYPVLFPKIAESIAFDRYFKEFMKDCASRRGILFKLTLLQCLIQGVQVKYGVQIYFPQKEENPRNQKFRISKAITFSSLPQLEKDEKRVDFPKIFSVENCFKELLTLAKDKPGEHFVGIRSQQQVFDEINPSIDFVAAYYDQEKGTFNLSTFDLTVSKSSSVKQENATELLRNFLKEEQGVNITHTIMCPKSAMPKKLKASVSNISIQYADIYRVEIFRKQSRGDADKFDVYRMLAKLYKYQEVKKQDKSQKNGQ